MRQRDPHLPASASGRRTFIRQFAAAGVVGAASAALTEPKLGAASLGGQTRQNFIDIRRHENDHVAFLESALGSNARAKPDFQGLLQPGFKAFVQVSQTLENTGVGAYFGAAPAIFDRSILAAAGSIALIEARHAGWLNTLADDRLTMNVYGEEQSFERPLTLEEVLTLATPFVASLNGGPAPTYSTTPSAANDIDILNFALLLEYLEAEFYNLNVPRIPGVGA